MPLASLPRECRHLGVDGHGQLGFGPFSSIERWTCSEARGGVTCDAVRRLELLVPTAAICSGTGMPSLSEMTSKDYVNPFSGDKSNSWKIPLHLLRNSNAFHTFGSVFIGYLSWHKISLCP